MRAVVLVLAAALALGACALFTLFVTDSTRLGGNALHGREADGRYYVKGRGGREIEISEADWTHNRALGIAVTVAIPIVTVGMVFVALGVALPKMLFRAPAEEREARVGLVRASAPGVETTCRGRLGLVRLGVGMIRAEVRPAGLVVQVKLLGAAAVTRDEIQAVEEKTRLWQRFVEVRHAGAHLVSPIRLDCKDVAFVEALKGLAARTA
jgi:hypothetical protein